MNFKLIKYDNEIDVYILEPMSKIVLSEKAKEYFPTHIKTNTANPVGMISSNGLLKRNSEEQEVANPVIVNKIAVNNPPNVSLLKNLINNCTDSASNIIKNNSQNTINKTPLIAPIPQGISNNSSPEITQYLRSINLNANGNGVHSIIKPEANGSKQIL